MIREIAINDVGPMAKIAVALDPRLNVFTGDNGLGKSLILDIAFWAQCGLWPRQRATPDERQRKSASIAWSVTGVQGEAARRAAQFDATRERWRRKTVEGDKPDRRPVIVYAMVDGGFAVFDQARAGGALHEDDADARMPFARPGKGYYVFAARDVMDGLTGPDGPVANGLIRDWPDWQYRHKKRFGALASALKTLSEEIGEPIRIAKPRRVSGADSREIPWIRLPYGEIPITHASAAVRRVAALAYMLVWAWAEHEEACKLTGLPRSRQLLLLFDEVECHLHPKWQRAILPALMAATAALTGKVETQILATTHSPLVLASLEPIFAEDRDQLHLIELDADKRATVRPILFHRMGRADTWLKSESFGLAEPMSAPAEKAVHRARALLRSARRPSPAALRRAIGQLRDVVSDTDPLLARLADMAELARPAAKRAR